MKNFIMSSLGLLMVALVSGCTTLPSPEKMAAELEGYSLPKQNETSDSLIYVVRPSSVGTIVRFNVFLDDKDASSEMGYTRGSQYIYFFAEPGQHTIFSKAENWAEVIVEVKAGETIFLKQDASIGIVMARNNIGIIQDLEGKYYVKNSSLGTIIKERK
jgi:hypothetical protein